MGDQITLIYNDSFCNFLDKSLSFVVQIIDHSFFIITIFGPFFWYTIYTLLYLRKNTFLHTDYTSERMDQSEYCGNNKLTKIDQ